MKNKLMLFIIIAVTSLFLPACHFHFDFLGQEKLKEVVLVPGPAREKILLLDIEGVITSGSQPNILSPQKNLVARVFEQLEMARRESKVKALIVRLETPGGEVAASDIIYHELIKFKRETGKPVISLMMGVAASGGYYIAMAGDYLIAHPSTLTGSIGVISIFPDLHGLMNKVGVAVNIIKSGPAKDAGSPFRPLTDEEKNLFQSIIDDYFQKFFDIVLLNRKEFFSADQLTPLASGQVFTASQALKEKLIDEIGYFETAYKKALSLARITSASVVTYTNFPKIKNSLYSLAPAKTDFSAADFLDKYLPWLKPGFYYLWLPETK